MINSRFVDELAGKLSGALPEGMSQFQADIEKNMRAILHSAFQKMDLVTREEFEVQAALLARSREKLEKIEAQMRDLEARLASK